MPAGVKSRPWDPDEWAAVLALREDGKSVRQIEARLLELGFERKARHIREKCQEEKIEARTHKWWSEDELSFLADNMAIMQAKDMAAALGRTIPMVHLQVEKLRGKQREARVGWSPVEIQIAANMRENGATSERIAKVLRNNGFERTANAVRWKCQQEGIGSFFSCQFPTAITRTMKQRFLDLVDHDGPIQSHMDTPCWEWLGNHTDFGHGRFAVAHGKTVVAHRVAWRKTRRKIPPGIRVLHRCDHPPCVRPDHLFLGTDSDNMQDCLIKNRRTQAKTDKDTIDRARKQRLSIDEIQELTGLSKAQSRRIVNGESWNKDWEPSSDHKENF